VHGDERAAVLNSCLLGDGKRNFRTALFCTMTNKWTIISQIITLHQHVSTLSLESL